MNKLYKDCAENVTRIVLAQVENKEVQYTDIISMVTAQIKHDLENISPKQHTFQRELTKFVTDLDNGTKEKLPDNLIVENLKKLVNQLNKDYLNPIKPEEI